jgi:hypothetical protein
VLQHGKPDVEEDDILDVEFSEDDDDDGGASVPALVG